MWQGKKPDGGPESSGEDYSPVSSYAPNGPVPPHMNTSHHVPHYADDGIRFSDASTPLPGSSYPHGTSQDYTQRSPAMSYACAENEPSVVPRSNLMDPQQRMPRYDQYPYAMGGSNRDSAWQPGVGPPPIQAPKAMACCGSSSLFRSHHIHAGVIADLGMYARLYSEYDRSRNISTNTLTQAEILAHQMPRLQPAESDCCAIATAGIYIGSIRY